MEKIYHTSPVEITKIEKYEKFGDCLFFANEAYTPGFRSTADLYIYSLELEENEVIHVSELSDELIIEDIISDLFELETKEEVDKDIAEKLLDGRMSLLELAPEECSDFSEYCDYDWTIQKYQGECSKKMGFCGAKTRDEQGTVYIIPMFGREKDLEEVK